MTHKFDLLPQKYQNQKFVCCPPVDTPVTLPDEGDEFVRQGDQPTCIHTQNNSLI